MAVSLEAACRWNTSQIPFEMQEVCEKKRAKAGVKVRYASLSLKGKREPKDSGLPLFPLFRATACGGCGVLRGISPREDQDEIPLVSEILTF
jgi:hypothetical protein